MYIPKRKEYIDLPTWRTLPSGKTIYIGSIEDAKKVSEIARDAYTSLKEKPNTPPEKVQEALEDYQAARTFAEEIPKKEIRNKEKPQDQFVFPLEVDSPSGYKYVFNNFNDLKNVEKSGELNRAVEFVLNNDKGKRSREDIVKEVQRDIEYLRKKREEVYDKGWLPKEEAWKKGMGYYESKMEGAKRFFEGMPVAIGEEQQRENRALEDKKRQEEILREAIRASTEQPSAPPQATAAPLQASAQAQEQQQASPPQATAAPAPTQAPQQPAQATAAPQAQEVRNRENFYGITEPNYPLNLNFPEDININRRAIEIANEAGYKNLVNKLETALQQARSAGDIGSLENVERALKYVKEQHINALNQRRANETPAFITNPDGSVIDTRTHEVVDPERIQLASAQERSRQLANRPFEPNPFETPSEVDPLLQQGINAVQQEQQSQQAAGQAPANNFEYPERNRDQEEAVQNYTNPARRDRRFETLRDRFLEASRNRAVKRFQDSMQDLGRMYSANRMGRNSMFEHQMGRAFRDTLEDMNVLDAQTEMNLMNMEEQHGGNRARFAEGQYGTDAARALEQYRENQLREERMRNRQRQAASDAIAAGTLRQNFNEQNRSRQSAEFMRRQGHPRAELNSHLDTLRAASHGLPQMQQEERMNVPAPRFVPQAAPPTLERENAPYGQQMPAQPPAPAPDTTFRDVAGVVLGAGELGMNMAANRRAEEAHRAAQATNLASTFQGRSQGGARSTG